MQSTTVDVWDEREWCTSICWSTRHVAMILLNADVYLLAKEAVYLYMDVAFYAHLAPTWLFRNETGRWRALLDKIPCGDLRYCSSISGTGLSSSQTTHCLMLSKVDSIRVNAGFSVLLVLVNVSRRPRRSGGLLSLSWSPTERRDHVDEVLRVLLRRSCRFMASRVATAVPSSKCHAIKSWLIALMAWFVMALESLSSFFRALHNSSLLTISCARGSTESLVVCRLYSNSDARLSILLFAECVYCERTTMRLCVDF